MPKRRIFIVGSKGVPASYGGFETFAEQISIRLAKMGFEVYVTCESDEYKSDNYNSVYRVHIKKSNLKFLGPIINDIRALKEVNRLAKQDDICYILGYGIGIFGRKALSDLKNKGITIWVNPDGLEWKRSRWPLIGKIYLRRAERFMLTYCDLVISDSTAIKEYILQNYPITNDKIRTIEYGAELFLSDTIDNDYVEFLNKHSLEAGQYYLTVGRFVPENNLETIVRGYIASKSSKPLVMIANIDKKSPLYKVILTYQLGAEQLNGRIVLAGPIYDQALLKQIRRHCFAYVHGHEVGGTNPSLLEAMGCGNLVIALDVPFNKAVLQDHGVYFNKELGSLSNIFNLVEKMDKNEIDLIKNANIDRITNYYNWDRIAELYAKLLEQ